MNLIYPEFLRTRRAVTYFVISLSVLVLIDLLSVVAHRFNDHIHVDVEAGVESFPISYVFIIVAFFTAIISTVIGGNLNRYRENAEVVMTLPMSRTRFAVSVLAIDLAALAVTFVFGLLLLIAVPFTVNAVWPHVAFDAQIVPRLALSFGSVFMWFAIIAAIGAWVRGRAGAIAGLSWPFFGILAALSQVRNPDWLRYLVLVLNYFNPIQYLVVVSGPATGIGSMPPGLQILSVWAIALIACLLAVAGWRRQEI